MAVISIRRVSSVVVFTSFLCFVSPAACESFDPYQLNGGLVCAIAGKNYCILAADTRMMDGGYQIYSRNLMRVFGIRGKALPMPAMNEEIEIQPSSWTSGTTGGTGSCITMVAAAGCESDCNALQRQLRYQIKAHGDDDDDDNILGPNNVAQLLANILYSRRSFPYYSFCVLGGLDDRETGGGSGVYGYDAVGSMERVAVATAGTGRELLQPILDRLFSSTSGTMVDCSSDEALALLQQAYHAVAERDIGVGDSLVLCLLTNSLEGGKNGESHNMCRILRVPLKIH